MNIREVILVTTFFLLSGVVPAFAQPALFSDPFASTEDILEVRGDAAPATMEITYSHISEGEMVVSGSPTIRFVVAPDWVAVYRGDQLNVLDFKLSRNFLVDAAAGEFASQNLLANLMFRIHERQNRNFISAALTKAGIENVPGACSMDTELGLQLPSEVELTEVRVEADASGAKILCGGEVTGEVAYSDRTVSASFWPVLVRTIPIHPQLYQHAIKSGHVPAKLEGRFTTSGGKPGRLSWQLESVEAVDMAYPIRPDYRNNTAAQLDLWIGEGFGAFAQSAVAGEIGDGAPTAESWDEYLSDLLKTEGPAAVAMKLPSTIRMFPKMVGECESNSDSAFCATIQDLRNIVTTDPAVEAHYTIAILEQNGDLTGLVPTMLRAQSSPLGTDAALGAAYALALVKGGQEVMRLASDAGLETDIVKLQSAAIEAYPYDPFYWQDLGDTYQKGFDHYKAYLFYDISFAVSRLFKNNENEAMTPRQAMALRVHHDFPHFFLN